ncbi:MAG: DUF1559 domain-containing protein [Zavarzinella sp.]
MASERDDFDYPRDDKSRRPRSYRRDEEDGDERDDFERRPRPAPPREGNGMATASLILGLLSACFGPTTGIVAIILGIIGYTKSSNSGGEIAGKGKAIAGIALGLFFTVMIVPILLYAVKHVRMTANMAKSTNNCKQILVGFHAYNDVNDRIPEPYVIDEQMNVNRDLSWRVSLLPYIEQDNIYRSIDLSAEWDSPENLKYTTMYIPTYSPPYLGRLDNQTPYRSFVGQDTVFDFSRKVQINRIPDGSSNTLIFVETTDTVPWASPQDIPYKRGMNFPSFGPASGRHFLVAMADGSVKRMRKSVSPQIIHGLITINGGEPVNEED